MTTTSEPMDDSMQALANNGQPTDALELTAFSTTVEQAAERFKAAGFPRSSDHISRWCRQGVLRATKTPTKNRLTRYLIDPRSIDEKIEVLKRERDEHANPQVFGAAPATTTVHRQDDDIDNAEVVPPRHWQSNREDAAELRGELRALKDQGRKDAARIEKLENENGGLRLSLGEYKGKSEALEKQVLQLMAPRPTEPEPPAPPASTATDADITPAPTPTSRWRRFWWGGEKTTACRHGHAAAMPTFRSLLRLPLSGAGQGAVDNSGV
jgi:hypothetical protein